MHPNLGYFMNAQHLSKSQIKLFRSLKLKKYRLESGLFIAEGRKCVLDLLPHMTGGWLVYQAGQETERLLEGFFQAYPLAPSVTLLEANEPEMAQISSLQTTPDLIGIFELPKTETDIAALTNLAHRELLLLLDGIQDPGNLGTVLRTADWFGISTVVCSHQTADCFAPKVVQATMGSLAHLKVYYTDLVPLVTELRKEGLPVYGTLLNGEDIYRSPLQSVGGLIMGNEGNGITENLREVVNRPLLIPACAKSGQEGHAESLNVGVATGIVLSEFRRR